MQFVLLATDYDGTIASDGKVDDKTLAALERVRASGRELILATGRHLDDLCQVLPQLNLLDLVVVENGGLLYKPETREEKLLCPAPDRRFLLTPKGAVMVLPSGVNKATGSKPPGMN